VTHSRSDIRALLDRHGLDPKRALGQNFVADAGTVRRIARLSGAGPDRPVLEIGAGLGSLTLALAETGAAVTAVETDKGLAAALRQVLRDQGADQSVEVVQADATACDWDELLKGRDDWQLVANLPYNIATPLIVDLLRGVPQIRSMFVMLQLEAAQRLAALPGDKNVGIPSLLVAWHAAAEIVSRVKPTVFVPVPKVDSALLRIERRAAPPLSALPSGSALGCSRPTDASDAGSADAESASGESVDAGSAVARSSAEDSDLAESPPADALVALADVEPLLRAAFGQRRKMLRRSLGALLSADDFAAGGVDPRRRPQTLSLPEWAALAAARRR